MRRRSSFVAFLGQKRVPETYALGSRGPLKARSIIDRLEIPYTISKPKTTGSQTFLVIPRSCFTPVSAPKHGIFMYFPSKTG